MFPTDLAAWKRWQASRHPVRRLRHALDHSATEPLPLVLHTRGASPVALFAVDATTPAAVASTISPLQHLGDSSVAVLAPADIRAQLGGVWNTRRLPAGSELPPEVREVRAVVGMGNFLPAGAQGYLWSRALHARFFVVQHGLLTPHAPPLPPEAHLLSFTDADAEFWRSARGDITAESIGSHLLWDAAHNPRSVPASAKPLFLGQLHGAELPRRTSTATAGRFCRATGAAYRPHPAEVDRLSRIQHAVWRRRGITFAPAGPLLEAGRPVVSIFSTGVLEAAAAGIPAWVTCLRPPAWLHEFWERYGMNSWGGPPTAPPRQPTIDPAATVATRVLNEVEGIR